MDTAQSTGELILSACTIVTALVAPGCEVWVKLIGLAVQDYVKAKPLRCRLINKL